MEFHSNCGEEPNGRKTSKVNSRQSSQTKERKKLGSMLNFDQCKRNHDNFHPQVLKNAEKYKGLQDVEGKSGKSEELVMYMSCLPSYLERGENPQEKPFNIGVLDWGALQKWKHNVNDDVGTNSKQSSSACYWEQTNLLKLHQSSLQATRSSGVDAVNRLTDSKSKDRDLLNVTGTRHKPLETVEIVSGLKRNGTIRKGDSDFPEQCNSAVPKSRNDPGSRYSAVHHQSDSSKGCNNRLLEEHRYTLYGGVSVKVGHANLRYDHTCFCSIAGEHGKTKDSQVEKPFAKEETRSLNRLLSGKEQTTQFTASVSVSPSKGKILDRKNSGSKPRNLAENENLQMEEGVKESTKVRNPSPTRRFGFGLGRIGKISNSNSSATANLVSENVPDPKATSTSACLNYSTPNKSNAARRDRSSPLRRLLDPILRPKGVDSHDIARSSERNPSKTDRRSSSRQVETAALHSVKRTLVLNGSRVDDIVGPHQAQKKVTSSMQALLQVAVKNGLPLFTFTVNNCSDILAATIKELSSSKSTRRWMYTFFAFKEMKKKNSSHWINQGSRDINQGYIPNIVAQMKVSDILYADSTEKCASNSSRREFVLSSVGSRDVDQTSDSLPGDELAAIVVKFSKSSSKKRGTFAIPQVRSCSNSGDSEGDASASDDLFSTMVILPGGHHGVPSKGEPSPLIERWKSGGSCDCGGWDLGCQLRILANNNRLNQRSKSTKSQFMAFELFSQEEIEERRPAFILSPFEDGIFSVEFNSSLKLTQAFSIGIAVLHSQTSAVLSSHMLGGKMSREITMPENSGGKSFNQDQVEVSAKYAANPPLSPRNTIILYNFHDRAAESTSGQVLVIPTINHHRTITPKSNSLISRIRKEVVKER